jgi:hypothetical protein
MTNPPTTRRRQTTRKSLRQSLKELLQRRRRDAKVQPGPVGSGILRKGGSCLYLPEPSRVSLFPNFESTTQFDIDSYSVHIPDHFADEVATVREASFSSPFLSRTSLLPARSLSRFNLNQAWAEHGKSYRPTQLSTVPETLTEGASRQASLVSLGSLRPSKSTLRIRESNRSLRSDRFSRPEVSHSSEKPASQPRSGESRRDLRGLANSQYHVGDPPTPVSPARSARSTQSGQPSITSINHFGSFCVLDTHASGCPVTATSADLKYIFKVGELFFLNNQECTDASMDIVTGSDADGNEVTHLVLFSPLVSPSSGRSRFLLAALIDVTFFIKDAAAVPELDMISEESVLDEGVATPLYRQLSADQVYVSPKVVSYELSCGDLLGGCSVEDDDDYRTPTYSSNERGIIPGMAMYADIDYADTDMKRDPSSARFEDVWTDLAREELIRGRKRPLASVVSARSGHNSVYTSPSQSERSSTLSKVDHVLENFMSELQQLYSDFFLLAKSPLDAWFYEICNVSPSVYVSKDYVHGHLSHSSRDTITQLSELLAEEAAFDINVRWGDKGEVKQLYCIPLFGQRDLTWICMLVDVKLGTLW